MASPDLSLPTPAQELTAQWRSLTRMATLVALLTAPAVFVWLYNHQGLDFRYALLLTVIEVAAFRGLVDLLFRRYMQTPSLFGEDNPEVRESDIVARRRYSFWRTMWKLAWFVFLVITISWIVLAFFGHGLSWSETASSMWHGLSNLWNPGSLGTLVTLPLFFLFNFLIFMGPMLLMGISQIRGYQPGDAEWGVKLEHVRGQAEAKEEIRRIVSLWQSGERFEQAGGKRERGLLFLGAPGTGKTMLAKAIATGFACPFVTIPGSGFAQTFIGLDSILVRYLARKAKRLARKWGGQCIVFIDEIDAVGMRRSSLGTAGASPFTEPTFEQSSDLVLETRAWRDRQFEVRAPERPVPPRFVRIVNQAIPGNFQGSGQMALNQLLVVMDGLDAPPLGKRMLTNSVNTTLDALYFVPRRVKGKTLRLPPPRPRNEQIYFIGATNVPIEQLDPALTRPGRMGRHVWFRTPTKQDREDIFDLYLGRVSHEPDLDRPERRDELARMTMGYSPAMIEQVCSMALTVAHHTDRNEFGWEDIVDAMTTVESGTAVNIEYVPDETRAVAIHEAGHAVAAHAYLKGAESTRLSIRRRGGSLGHHMALQKEERFSSWRSEEMARLIWALGAMAAERVFYGENSTGVGGDVQAATDRAAWMVGACGMAPEYIELRWVSQDSDDESEDAARERVMRRFQKIGTQIINRTKSGGPGGDPLGAVLSDPQQRAMVEQLLGQAYLAAHHLVEANREAVERVADVLVDRRELYGDEVVNLLDAQSLRRPEVDLTRDEAWPKL